MSALRRVGVNQNSEVVREVAWITYLGQKRKKGKGNDSNEGNKDSQNTIIPRGFECVRLLLHGVPHHLPEALGHGEGEVSGRDLRRVDGAALEYL